MRRDDQVTCVLHTSPSVGDIKESDNGEDPTRPAKKRGNARKPASTAVRRQRGPKNATPTMKEGVDSNRSGGEHRSRQAMLSKEVLVAPGRTTAAHIGAKSTIHCQVGNRAQKTSRWDALTKKRRTTGMGQSCLPQFPRKHNPIEEGARSRGRPHPSRSTQDKCQEADRTPRRPKSKISMSGPAASVRPKNQESCRPQRGQSENYLPM